MNNHVWVGLRVQQMHCHLIISVPGLEKILVKLEKILLKLFRKYQWLLPMNSFFVTCAVKKFTYDLCRIFIWQLENQFFASSYFWLAYIFEASYSTVVVTSSAKNQVSTNQNLRNRWCLIVRHVMSNRTECAWVTVVFLIGTMLSWNYLAFSNFTVMLPAHVLRFDVLIATWSRYFLLNYKNACGSV